VDELLTVQEIDEVSLESRLQPGIVAQPAQKIITSAAQILSSLSQFAGVVMTPRTESTFHQLEFLRLSEKGFCWSWWGLPVKCITACCKPRRITHRRN
jgi:heat-inducible transcriptional repressor